MLRSVALVAMLLGLALDPAQADDRDRMRLAAEQLVTSQLPSGLFPYDFNFLTGGTSEEEIMTSPNLVRQTGTAYILAAYHARYPSEAARHAIEAALDAYGRMSLAISRGGFQHAVQKTRILSAPIGRRTIQKSFDWLGLLYSPDGDGKLVSPDGSYEAAWVGATGLALLTELEYFAATGDDRFAGLRAGWLEGILSLSLPGGGLRAAPHWLGEEHYFNAEGWLALATYADMFRDDEAPIAEIERLETYLIERYSQRWSRQFYSWGAMASAVRLRTTGDEKFLRFMEAQSRSALEAIEAKPADQRFVNCAQLEGLGAAARTLEAHPSGDRALATRLRAAIDRAMPEIRDLQILPGQDRIAFGDGTYLVSPHMPDHVGAFRSSAFDPEVRIDHTFHCLSAMLILDEANEAP
jgi:hypothetical protein